MAQFEWLTRRIDLRTPGHAAWNLADLHSGSLDPVLIVTLSHEYVHYLQIVSSLPGLRLLGDLVSFAVKGAVTLANVPLNNGKITGYYKILELLRVEADGAGKLNPDILDRGRRTLDEANALMGPHDFPYDGPKGAWEVDVQQIAHNSYVEPMHGIVVPRRNGERRFRPLSPGMLAEAMARRIDRWLNDAEGFDHSWTQNETENEHYNGLMNVLSHSRFDGIVDGDLIQHLVVIIAHLALGTPRPDRSAAVMLELLERGRLDMNGPGVVAHQLRRELVSQRLLHSDHYNEIMHDLMHGDAQVMSRHEFYAVYELMKHIHFAANALLDCPDFYADNTVDWARVKAWMSRRGLPPIRCDDGTATSVMGIQCEETAVPLLLELQRVLLP